jgi:regulator of sigma E protease
VDVAVERDGRELVVPVTIATRIERDRFGNEAKVGRIGIAGAKFAIVSVGIAEAASMSVEQSVGIVRMMATGIGQIITGERSVKELGGPLKIAKYSGEQLSLGLEPFVWFAALISINLAFINLLPIPTLDGGHLAFYAAEAVRRRPVSLRGQELAFRTGMALVLALMLFVTINDLLSFNLFG